MGLDPLPGVSVVLPTHAGVRWIDGALTSLAEQTLDTGRFEVVVVANGPDDGTADVVRTFAAQQPTMSVRLVRLSQAGVGRAVNFGVAAARHEYLTLVDDDDTVSPEYLEQLLAAAAPDVVAQGFLVDVTEGSEPPVFDTYINRSLTPAAGRTVHPREVSSALSFNTAKVVLTALARMVPMREDLRVSPDVVFWHTLVNRFALSVRVVDLDANAVYRRFVRSGSHSRPHLRTWESGVAARLDAIEALEPIARDSSQHLHVVSGWIVRTHARRIAAHLRDHPDDHGRLVEEVRARDLHPSIWRTLNQHRARDLVIAYAFPPTSDTSALVVARRVRAGGVAVDVVAHEMADVRGQDPSGQVIVEPYLGHHTVVRGRSSFGSWNGIARFVREGLAKAEGWSAEQGEYRTVYSRAMWPASHVLGALWKVRHPGTRWIAEFSDPISRTIHHERRGANRHDDELTRELDAALAERGHPAPAGETLFEWIERLTFALADEIWFTNENQRAYMASLIGEQPLRDRVLERGGISAHPTLPPEFYRLGATEYPLDPDLVHVAYFGAFYPTRGLTEVVAAIEQLDPDERRRLRLHVFTGDPDTLRDQLSPGLAEVVVANPYVPYLDFLQLSTTFDCLLVNDIRTADTHDLNPYVPSKVSDYRGAGVPIWSVVEPGSILSRQASTHRSDLGDVEGAQRVLRALLSAPPDSH